MDNRVVFSISTQLEMEGRTLEAVKPDKKGVYRGIPLTVIGLTSRNRVSYVPESVKKCLTDVEQRFAANVSSGDMEGEWGHPLIATKEDLPRLLHIDRTKYSHYFTRVYGVTIGDGTAIIVYGDVVPAGPYGPYLKESFEDPKRNTSFSLRSAARVVGQNEDGVVCKEMLALVTFDAVDGPGYLNASKRFRDLTAAAQVASESMLEVNRDDYEAAMNVLQSCGQESIINNQQILDVFRTNKITIRDTVAAIETKGNYLVTNQGPKSIFGTMFKG